MHHPIQKLAMRSIGRSICGDTLIWRWINFAQNLGRFRGVPAFCFVSWATSESVFQYPFLWPYCLFIWVSDTALEGSRQGTNLRTPTYLWQTHSLFFDTLGYPFIRDHELFLPLLGAPTVPSKVLYLGTISRNFIQAFSIIWKVSISSFDDDFLELCFHTFRSNWETSFFCSHFRTTWVPFPRLLLIRMQCLSMSRDVSTWLQYGTVHVRPENLSPTKN